MQRAKTWVSLMAPILTSCEVLGTLSNLSLFITSKMEKTAIISTLYTILRTEADNDDVKDPHSKHSWEPNIEFILGKKGKEVWMIGQKISTNYYRSKNTEPYRKMIYKKRERESITWKGDECKVFINGTLHRSC